MMSEVDDLRVALGDVLCLADALIMTYGHESGPSTAAMLARARAVLDKSRSFNEKVFRLAPLNRVEDFLRLGWLPHDSLAGTPHGGYAVLVEWLCCCGRPACEPAARPRP